MCRKQSRIVHREVHRDIRLTKMEKVRYNSTIIICLNRFEEKYRIRNKKLEIRN